MIESLVRGALGQRLIVAVVAAILFFFGLDAARKLSVDAFPDVTNIQVQIATEAPGRSPEEVERFATVWGDRNDVVPGIVERRTCEVIHGSIDDGEIFHLTRFEIFDAREQHARIANQATTWFEQNLQFAILELLQQGLQVVFDRWSRFVLIADAEATTEINVMQ